MDAYLQVLKVNTLYIITMAAYRPKRKRKINGRRYIISCDCLKTGKLLLSIANHIAQAKIAHDNHSNNFVICNCNVI